MLHAGENIVEGIPVEVVRKRIRRINLRVAPDGVVWLSVPLFRATLREGERFLRTKLDWVRRTRKAVLSRPSPECEAVGEGEIATLREILTELNAMWAARLHEPDVVWRLREVKTFWGTCNWRKRLITYNIELARAPRELVEYVVVHELTHLQAHDHGPGFYALMTARLPRWQELRKRLNRREWVQSARSNDAHAADPQTIQLVQAEFPLGI